MRKITSILATVALTVLALTACTVPDDSNTTASQGGDGGNNNKSTGGDNSSKGKGPLVWGNWQVVGKIQVKDDGLHDFDVVARVKNTGDSPDEGLFTVTILKGNKILGTADCSTSTVGPAAIGTADCFSMDKYVPGWTEVTIENAF